MGVQISREGSTAILRFDWPERRNALGPEQARSILDALSTIEEDPEARALVLTGTGTFCAGGDLQQLRGIAQRGPDAVRQSIYGIFQELVRRLLDLRMPTAAALDGPAIGLGMDIALACDRRFVGPRGWMLQGWSLVGLIPGTGGAHLLQRRCSGKFWSLLASTDRLGPEQLAEYGLATVAD